MLLRPSISHMVSKDFCPTPLEPPGLAPKHQLHYAPLIPLLGWESNATMSFGYGVGDFLAIAKLVDTVRKQFTDAPGHYKAISDE